MVLRNQRQVAWVRLVVFAWLVLWLNVGFAEEAVTEGGERLLWKQEIKRLQDMASDCVEQAGLEVGRDMGTGEGGLDLGSKKWEEELSLHTACQEEVEKAYGDMLDLTERYAELQEKVGVDEKQREESDETLKKEYKALVSEMARLKKEHRERYYKCQ